VAYLQNQDGIRIVLGSSGIRMGRDELNDVPLQSDPRVSRSHAEIINRNGQWVLIDLGSKNGTFVNDRPISRHPLREGDRVRIGDSVWRFLAEHDPHATEAAADADTINPRANLTEREVDVLKLVSDGLSDKDIAQSLHISVNTVRSHLDRVGQKTGLRKRSELTRLALQLNLDLEQ
jgi:DNA-binding CsgD family transcriptional regulator